MLKKLNRPTRILLLGLLLSSLGGGMTTPFIALFASRELGLSPATVGAALSTMAVSFTVSMWAGGQLADRTTPYAIAVLGQIFATIGYIALAFAGSSNQAIFLSLTCAGLGGLATPAISKILVQLNGRDSLEETFGAQYAVQNMGLGIGTALSGFLVANIGYHLIFLANAASFAVFASVVAALGARSSVQYRGSSGTKDPAELAEVSPPRGHEGRIVAILFLVGLLVSTAGFSQLESGIPLSLSPETSTSAVGLAWTLNTIAIIILQARAVRITKTIGRWWSLSISVLLFAISIATFFVLNSQSGLLVNLALPVAMVIFSFGETLYMPASSAILNSVIQPDRMARANSMLGISFSLGDLIGPSVAGRLISINRLYWFSVMIALLLLASSISALGQARGNVQGREG